MFYNYKKFLSTERFRKSSLHRSSTIEEFYSDRSRILFCTSFRRLIQKAQVFSLESNSSVRTRLTHSLEVSDIGRTLANQIAYKLKNKSELSQTNIQPMVAVVENACLLHDIGNPPFGHFGESAIRKWAEKDLLKAAPDIIIDQVIKSNDEDRDTDPNYQLLDLLLADFREFDGNPQGFRTVSKLHTDYDEYSLNLTYATLLSILKYSRAAGEAKGDGILKKAGYFQSEKPLVEKLYQAVDVPIHHRTPLVYIMEAADDIAYCMSDIADGIEKRILTEETFIKEFKKAWEEGGADIKELPVKLPKDGNLNGFNRDISVPWSRAAVKEAVDTFFKIQDSVYDGTATEILPDDGSVGKVFKTVKEVSRKALYNSIEAESIELTGYAVIEGILNNYEPLLQLDEKTFSKLVNNEAPKGTDLERRLFHRIGERYVKAYTYAKDKLISNEGLETTGIEFQIKEWWLRIHMLIDHISGMTDDYALETYQMLEGINLLKTR